MVTCGVAADGPPPPPPSPPIRYQEPTPQKTKATMAKLILAAAAILASANAFTPIAVPSSPVYVTHQFVVMPSFHEDFFRTSHTCVHFI